MSDPEDNKESEGLWLFKEEPENYPYERLVRDGRTVWDGVKNPQAQKYMRQVKTGDRVLYYHTGKQKAIVGEMRVVLDPYPDPSDSAGKRVVLEVEPIRLWPVPVSLNEIKKEETLANWELVRLPRLSVMPVTSVQWNQVETMSRSST